VLWFVVTRGGKGSFLVVGPGPTTPDRYSIVGCEICIGNIFQDRHFQLHQGYHVSSVINLVNES